VGERLYIKTLKQENAYNLPLWGYVLSIEYIPEEVKNLYYKKIYEIEAESLNC
jgi:hypothetical protein